MIKELLNKNPLYVFALKSEASDKFVNESPLFIGVGKVNAAYHLTKQIAQNKPSIIINLGSAGSNFFERGAVICCTQFIQRDMNVTTLGCELYETPFSNTKPILKYGIRVHGVQEGICGTGDSFEVSHNTSDYNIVDMEAYPLAYIAKKEDIPFLCLKYISDGADDNAAEDWNITVKKAAEALRQAIDELKR